MHTRTHTHTHKQVYDRIPCPYSILPNWLPVIQTLQTSER